jgi:trimeric autotransporter adhesin
MKKFIVLNAKSLKIWQICLIVLGAQFFVIAQYYQWSRWHIPEERTTTIALVQENKKPQSTPKTLDTLSYKPPLSISTVLSSFLPPTVTLTQTVSAASIAPGGNLDYTFVLSNSGTDATNVVFTNVLSNDLTLVAGSVKATPIATNDAYTSLGNVGITVPAANGLLANDVSPDNTTITATAVTNAATTDGGKITIQTNGAIDYTPKTGTTATSDTYTYTLNSSNGKTSTGTVTITLSGMLWFVNKAATSNGDGSLASPFQDWSNFGTVNTGGSGKPDNNHTVFIYSNVSAYSGAVTLRSGQKVLGQGATTTLASFAGLTVPTFSNTLPTTSGTNPNLTSSGTTITVPTSGAINLRGFDMGNSTIDIASGASFGTLTTSEMILSGTGAALSLVSGTLATTFMSITASGGTNSISITSCSGSFSGGNTNLSGGTGTNLALAGNTASFTFGSLDIAATNGQNAINITSHSTGTITCTSGTITESNGVAINIAGSSSSAKAPLAMVLTSVSKTGTSSTNGMTLSNTSGSFAINGTGTTAGSGGTISTCTQRGANIVDASNITLKNMNFTNSSTSTTACSSPASDNSNCNAAIHAKTVSGLTLNNIAITGTHRNMGINLNDVTNFSLASSTITAVGGATGVTGNEAGGIYALNLKGTCSITNSNINDSNGRNFYCENNSNQTMSLTVTGSQFKNTFGKTVGGANFMFRGFGASNNTVVLKTNDFSNPRTYGLHISATGSSVNTVQVGGSSAADGNTIVAAATSPGSNAFALQSGIAHTGSINYNVLNNNFQVSFNGGDLFNIGGQGTAAMQGRCNNNTATAVSTNGSNGILIAQYGKGTHRAEVHNNTISGVNNLGITIDSRDNGTSSSNGRVDASVLNNNISLTASGYAHVNVTAYADAGSSSNMKSCIRVGGNTTNSGTGVIAEFDVVSTPSPNQVILQGTTAFVAPFSGSRTANLTTFWTANGQTGTAIDESGEGAFGGASTMGSIIAGTCLVPSNPVASLMVSNTDEETPNVVKNKLTEEKTEEVKEVLVEEKINAIEPQTENSHEEVIKLENSVAALQSGETVTVNGTGSGFTIPMGKSTTITFSATVSSTPSACSVSNSATASGSNFSTVNSNTQTTTITIPNISAPTAPASSVCSGGALTMGATCSSGTLNWWTAASGGSSVSTSNTYSPTNVTSPTSYYASCTIGSCEGTRSLVGAVTINALPSTSITATPNPVCQNSNLSLNVAAGQTTYTWSGNGLTSSNAASKTATPTATGSQTYSVTVTGTNGCVNTGSTSVTVNPQPDATITAANSVCQGSTLSLDAPAGATTYAWAGNGLTSSNNASVSAKPTTTGSQTYSVTVTGSNTCTKTGTKSVTVNVPTFSTSPQTTTTTISGTSANYLYGTSCNLIAILTPTGAAPVSGSVTANSWYETTQPSNYVKRHFEITPTTNANTATGTVVFYFTQADFDDFNAVNAIKLPIGSGDAAGIARLLIEKISGSSSDGTGLPNSYSGTVQTLDPDDANVVWNATNSRWEITISVTGFSGFFVKTQSAVLPVELLSFEGKNTEGGNLLIWTTAEEKNTLNFDIERSKDGRVFEKIGVVKAKGSNATYDYLDTKFLSGSNYYRLKINDLDGKFDFSKVINLENTTSKKGIKVYPNPASQSHITVELPQNTEGGILVVNAVGQVVYQNRKPPLGVWGLDISTWSSGVYFIKSGDEVVRFVKN